MLTVFLLFALLSLLLLVILAIADYALQANAFPGALAIVVGLAVLFIFFQWLISPFIVRWAIRDRRPITAESNPWVYRTVEETARQAGVPTPKIWESGDDSPNAFVFGRTISSAELVITQGLLERLNQDEIRAVLAHEIGHLRHRDVIIMTLMSAVPLIAYVIARLGFEALRGNARVRGKGAGQAFIIIIASAIVSYAVYLVAQLLVLYLSRTREYYAAAYSGSAPRAPPTSSSGPIRRPSSGSTCSRRWKKKSRRAGSRKTSTSSCELGGRIGPWPARIVACLRDVLAPGAPHRVCLRVPRHDEDRPEDDHHEDREEDQVQQLREVGRAARENRAVEAARADHEEAAGKGTRDAPVVACSIHHVVPEGKDHRREAGPPEALVDSEGRGDEQDVGEDRHEDDRRDRRHREEDRRRQLGHGGPARSGGRGLLHGINSGQPACRTPGRTSCRREPRGRLGT